LTAAKGNVMERLGIYGGTFSPPHLGHVHAAKVFLREMQLDKLLIIPTYIPPHKTRNEQTSVEDRLAMCKLAFSFSDKIEVSDMEIRRGGKSYTSDTLCALKTDERSLFFLCGTDMFLTIDAWHEPQTIFAHATIVCMQRENDPFLSEQIRKKSEFYRLTFGAETYILHGNALKLSSSEVRADITEHGDFSEKLSPTVAEYIQKRGLYL